MTHASRRVAFAFACAALSISSAAFAAPTYGITPYDATPQSNPWRLTTSFVNPDDDFAPPYASVQTRYDLSNTVTGETRSFTRAGSRIGTSAYVVRTGEVIIGESYQGMPATYYVHDGQQAKEIGSGLMGLAWVDQGIYSATVYSQGSYRGQRYENGQWYAVSGFGAPSGSGTNDVSPGGIAVGWTANMGLASNARAVEVLANGDTFYLAQAQGAAFGATTRANGVNDAGFVVGQQANYLSAAFTPSFPGAPWGEYDLASPFAVLWDAQHQAHNLNDLIDPSSSLYGQVTLLNALSIDAQGTIIASGYLAGQPGQITQFSLSAVPEPSSLVLGACGALSLLALRARSRRRGHA